MSSTTDTSSTNFVDITTMTRGSGTSWPAVKIIAPRATKEMEECPATVCPARLFQSAHQPVASVMTATHEAIPSRNPLVTRPAGSECLFRQSGCDATDDKEDPPAVVLRMLPFEGAVGGDMNATQVLPSPPGEFSTTAAPMHENRPTEGAGKMDDESSTARWGRATGSLLQVQPHVLHAMHDAFGDARRRFCSATPH